MLLLSTFQIPKSRIHYSMTLRWCSHEKVVALLWLQTQAQVLVSITLANNAGLLTSSLASRTRGRWLSDCQSCFRFENPADIGTKRLNVHRMKALIFLLGMFDSTNNCLVREAEAHSIIQLFITCVLIFVGGWYVYKTWHAIDEPNVEITTEKR